jgi:hypothetical protein
MDRRYFMMRPSLIFITLTFLFIHEISSLLFLDIKHKGATKNLSLSAKNEKLQQIAVPQATDISVVRRSLLQNVSLFSAAVIVSAIPSYAKADDELEAVQPLTIDRPLYLILRAREATEQETRLIKTGKFKDVQRANVKLAIRSIVNNYRLNDNIIAAASFLEGNKKFEASDVGRSATEALYTILEYFDSSDVQNLKVGMFDSMAGKEVLVLKGLEAAKSNIDKFLAFFPKSTVENIQKLIQEENDLNQKEFDPNLGVILNPNPTVV